MTGNKKQAAFDRTLLAIDKLYPGRLYSLLEQVIDVYRECVDRDMDPDEAHNTAVEVIMSGIQAVVDQDDAGEGER